MIAKDLQRLAVPLDQVHEDPDNARRHDKRNLDAIKASLQRFGQQKAIVTTPEGRILAGNGTYAAARALGWKKIARSTYDGDPDDYAAYAVADNHTAELASWDQDILLKQLQAFSDEQRAATGYTQDDLEALLKELEGKEGPQYTDDIDYDGPKIAKMGDTYILGDHRVLVADAFNKASREALLKNHKVHVLFSDPPFGVNLLQGKKGVRGPGGKATIGGKGLVKPRAYAPVEGDDKPFDPAPFLDLAGIVLLFGANAYASRLPDNPHWLVWDKHPKDHGQDALSFGDCELIWTNIKKRISVKVYRHHWTGLLREGNRKDEMKKRIHPTQKPVALCASIIDDYAPRGATVLDPFLGSGSTLIACEKTNRTCLGMEIVPHYADAVAKRWHDYTGKPVTIQRANGKKEDVTW